MDEVGLSGEERSGGGIPLYLKKRKKGGVEPWFHYVKAKDTLLIKDILAPQFHSTHS